MSNVIKAYSISYDEPVKKLDMNEKAENFRRLYEENLEKKFEEQHSDGEDEESVDGFSEGIVGERVFFKGSEEETLSEQEKKILDNQREIKKLQTKIEELRVEAGKILDEAEEQAESIMENARSEAQNEYENLINTYMEQGYAEGREQAEKEYNNLKNDLKRKIQETEDNYEKQVSELEPAFVEILIKYIEKLTGIYATSRTEVIMHVIHQAMTKQTPCRNFIIRVSPADYGTVLNSKPEILLWLPDGSQIEVVEDKMLTEGGCMIETDTRIFDCSVETQMRSLIEDLRLLAGDSEVNSKNK
ncbi:MAG: hypothetical protein IKP88_00325 [Lachnospiraceae bacterium]|nr:hypothetical protein [Lachnospiraceae bacterium]